MPLIPAPPMPMKCTAPELGSRTGTGSATRRRHRSGGRSTRSPSGPPRAPCRQPLVGVGHSGRGGVPGVAGQRGGVGEQRHQVRADPGRASGRRPRRAGRRRPRRRAGRCGAARRCRSAAARRPPAARRPTARRRSPRPTGRARGRRRRRRGPCAPDSPRRRRAHYPRGAPGTVDVGVLRARGRAAPGPRRAVSASAARDDRAVQRRRPLRPADDQQRRPVGVQPEGRRAPRRGRPARSSELIARRSGMPTCSALGSGVPGMVTADPRGDPGTDPVGQAGQRVLLVHHDRHPRRAGRRGRPAAPT